MYSNVQMNNRKEINNIGQVLLLVHASIQKFVPLVILPVFQKV